SAEGRADRSRRAAESAEQDASDAAGTALSLRARLESVEGAVGADYRAVLAEIDRLRNELRAARAEAGLRQDALLARPPARRAAPARGGVHPRGRAAGPAGAGRRGARAPPPPRSRPRPGGTRPADAGSDLTLSASDGTRATLDAARAAAARWPNIPHA